MLETKDRLLSLYEDWLQTTVDLMDVCMCGAERLDSYQIQAIRQALREHAEEVSQIDSALDADELLTIQMDMTLCQMQDAMSFWHGCCLTTNQSLLDVIGYLCEKYSDGADEITPPPEMLPVVPQQVMSAFESLNMMVEAAYSEGITSRRAACQGIDLLVANYQQNVKAMLAA